MWLQIQLEQQGIGIRYTHDEGGVLRGVSFELNGVGVTGQQVGYKAAQLRELFPASPATQSPLLILLILPIPPHPDQDEEGETSKQKPKGPRW